MRRSQWALKTESIEARPFDGPRLRQDGSAKLDVTRNAPEMVEALAQKANLSFPRARDIFNQVFDCMKEALLRGESVTIRGFGTFTVRHYRAFE
jgi:hypothetical protein